ncbi:MAG: FAD-dependent oxidoreductase, partial [Solirubrobacteraceae bacterium]
HVLTPEQIMLHGKRPPGERVVVYDAEGYTVGPGVAELLAREGAAVELVTPLAQVAPVCDQTLEGPMLRARLHEAGVVLRRDVTVTAIEPGTVGAEDEFGGPLELAADAIVLVTRRSSDDALYHELATDREALAAEGIAGLYRIGDCVAPRLCADAIFDGHRLAREIDADDPSVPLPYRRERALVGAAVGIIS